VRGALEELTTGDPRTDAGYLEQAAAQIEASSIDEKPRRGEAEYRVELLEFIANLSRRLYLIGRDGSLADLAPDFPVRTFDTFIASLGESEPHDETRSRLLRQLNATLGVSNSGIEGLLVPRDYARGLTGTGLAAIVPPQVFDVVPATILGGRFNQPRYVEAWPRALALVARDDKRVVASLTVPLLLFEILERAGRGFRPTTQTERGFMVRVSGFYRRLAEYRWRIVPTYALYDSGSVLAQAVIEPDKVILTELG
jgi:hypothetical protein